MSNKGLIKSIVWGLAVICLLINSNAFSMERFDIVTTEELKEMLEKRTAGRLDFLLVNGLDKIVYRDGSIPDSINIPWSNVKENAFKLGADKNKLIITY